MTVLDPELVSDTFNNVRPTIDPAKNLEDLEIFFTEKCLSAGGVGRTTLPDGPTADLFLKYFNYFIFHSSSVYYFNGVYWKKYSRDTVLHVFLRRNFYALLKEAQQTLK